MTVVIKSQTAYAGVGDLGNLTVVSKSATDIYTAYAARVAADGGAVTSSTRAQNAITDAVNKGYYHPASLILSANFGVKTTGSGPTLESKLYNMAPTGAAQDGICTGTVEHDTTTEAFATSFMNSGSLDFITVTAMPLCKKTNGSVMFAMCGRWPTAGGQMSFTTGGVLWAMLDYVSRCDIGPTKIAAAPEYATASKTAVAILVDQSSGKLTLLQDGSVKKSAVPSAWTNIVAGATADVTIKIASGTDWRLAECWYMQDANLDAAINLTLRMNTDY
jgi:hypothetical protein